MEEITISTPEFPVIHYRRAGSGQALVLLHGFPEDGGLWDDIVPELSSTCTVIVPDIPGAGKTVVGGNTVTMAAMAGAVSAILDHAAISRAVIVGHSMGGYVALAFAALYPGRLKGLSLVHSIATADSDEKKETRRKAIALLEKGGRDAFVQGMIPQLFAASFRRENPEVISRQITRAKRLSAASMILLYEAMIARADHTVTLRDSQVPVQWIIGKEDALIPFSVAIEQSKLPSVSFISVYNDTGHMSMIEQPQTLTADLIEFTRFCYKP